jgi:Glycerate kinase family
LLEGCPIVPSRTLTVGIPHRLLLACEAFGPRLPGTAVAAAISRGVQDGGMPEPDVFVLAPEPGPGLDTRRLLDDLGFDARMRSARAVVIGAARLHEDTLAGSVAFEIATRARQGGVPAYAIAAASTLGAFDARILDLQLILEARSRQKLLAAGRELAELA